jgi:hypothetical protein
VFELGPADETEVIQEFAQAELASERFGSIVSWAAKQHGPDPRLVLGETRGYPDRRLFQGFPRDVKWRRVLLAPSDAASVHLNPVNEWHALTKGTRSPAVLVEAIRSPAFPDRKFAERTRAIAELYIGHQNLPWVLLVTDGRKVACLEGNTRLTAYVRSGVKYMLPAYLGESASMASWIYF